MIPAHRSDRTEGLAPHNGDRTKHIVWFGDAGAKESRAGGVRDENGEVVCRMEEFQRDSAGKTRGVRLGGLGHVLPQGLQHPLTFPTLNLGVRAH